MVKRVIARHDCVCIDAALQIHSIINYSYTYRAIKYTEVELQSFSQYFQVCADTCYYRVVSVKKRD